MAAGADDHPGGLAARNLAVDELVVIGSPGTGTAEAAELGGPARMWAGPAMSCRRCERR